MCKRERMFVCVCEHDGCNYCSGEIMVMMMMTIIIDEICIAFMNRTQWARRINDV